VAFARWAIGQYCESAACGRLRGGIALIVGCSAFLYVVLSLASAYLRERTNGRRGIVINTLYLIEAHGLPPIALFTIASRGAVLKMPEVIGLFVLFVCLVFGFRPSIPKHSG
jgi:hypothetical protein